MNFKKLTLIYVGTFVLNACQTVYVPQARDIKKKPKSNGVIAMPLNFKAEDRQKAEMMMTQNCGPQTVSVLEEGEVVVGQETKTNSSETNRDDSRYNAGNLFGIPVMGGQNAGKESQHSSVTSQIKEWQISYECGQANHNTKVK